MPIPIMELGQITEAIAKAVEAHHRGQQYVADIEVDGRDIVVEIEQGYVRITVDKVGWPGTTHVQSAAKHYGATFSTENGYTTEIRLRPRR